MTGRPPHLLCPRSFEAIAAAALAVPAVTLALAACEGCRPSGAPTNGARSESADAGDVGPPTLRLYLLTDLAGALEPCGCTKDQLGGLDHFGAWVKREGARAPAALIASAGPLFFLDDTLDKERADQDRIKAETIARVLHGLGFAAFAPGMNDWVDGDAGLRRLASASGAAVILRSDEAPPFVREVGGVKVGFVGVGQSPPGRPPAAGANVEQSVARGVEAVEQQGANVVIALAAVGRGEAKRIADAVPGLTAVVVGSPAARGDGNTTAPPPERVGDVLVVQAANHLQSVAVVDLYVRDPVVPGHLVTFADATGLELARRRDDLARRADDLHVKIVAWQRDPSVAPGDLDARRRELAALEKERDALAVTPPMPAPARGSFFRYALQEVRDSLGKDPSIDAEMLAYYKAVDEHNRVLFAGRVPPPRGPDQAIYVGVDACTTCHAPARAVWDRTGHAHAYATLSSQFKEFNLECVGCHVTGYERPGGSTVTHVDRLRDVQCEVCHGPGSKHVISPLDPGTIVARPQPGTCLACHHSPHVEGFDPVGKMREILGPGHGMAAR
jgi:Cytochrome c554 and c-prime